MPCTRTKHRMLRVQQNSALKKTKHRILTAQLSGFWSVDNSDVPRNENHANFPSGTRSKSCQLINARNKNARHLISAKGLGPVKGKRVVMTLARLMVERDDKDRRKIIKLGQWLLDQDTLKANKNFDAVQDLVLRPINEPDLWRALAKILKTKVDKDDEELLSIKVFRDSKGRCILKKKDGKKVIRIITGEDTCKLYNK